MKKITNYINHIVFVVDASSSMGGVSKDVIKVFDSQVEYLKRRSKELEQETRISLYTFSNTVSNVVFDMDCLRMPSLAGYYEVGGMTALIDGTVKAIEDAKKIPELYGDSSHLIYVLTDGEENRSTKSASTLSSLINSLPDNWTVAVFTPNQIGVSECKRFGFPANNISVWDATSAKGVSEMGEKVRQVTENYMTQRAQGVRGTKDLFSLKTNISSDAVRSKLKALDPKEYMMISVHQKSVIKPFIESWTQKPYVVGSGYYQLTKAETIQAYKQLAIKNKISGKVYAGTEARQMLGLPNHEVKVAPAQLATFDIFAQSTSVNRNLMPGTQVLVML